MSKPYPTDNWPCKCTLKTGIVHAPGVRACFICGMVNPAPRVSRPVAANGGPPANDTAVSRSPGRPAPKTAKQATAARQPTATEQRYYETFLSQPVADGECRAIFEGVTLHLRNGHRYTPDWAVFWYADKISHKVKVELVEVKGAYKLGSYQRARLAFDQAAMEFLEFEFVWYEETNGDTP